MRRTNLILGMSLLLLAAAIGVYTTGATLDLGDRKTSRADRARGAVQPNAPRLTRNSSKSSRARGSYVDVLESFHVDPLGPAHPALAAQAQRVETGARNRLIELSEELDLTDEQKVAIFPLLARSHPDYSSSLHIMGVPLGASLTALGKLAANHKIHELLNPDQQLELEIMAASADVWWADVIARLERDLEQSTKEPVPSGPAPHDDPAPPDEPPPAPPAPLPTQRTGGNLLDRLRGGGS